MLHIVMRVPKTPQHNGVAERMNRTIGLVGEIIRCILSHVKLPKSFLGEAVRTAVDLINLSPLQFLLKVMCQKGSLRFLYIGFAFEVVTESIVQEGALTVFAFFAALDAIESD